MARFAANISFLFTELPFLDRIQAAAATGFGAVECHYPYDTSAEATRAALDEAGIPMLGINTRNGTPSDDGGSRDTGLAAVSGREADSLARVHQAVDYAHAIGGRAVHVTAGDGHPDDLAARDAFVAALRRASERSDRLTFLIEPLNRRENPAYFLRSTAQALDILDRVGHPNVRLMFDLYHAEINEGSVLERLPSLLPRIGHIQVAAVPDRGEPDTAWPDLPAVCRTLDALGYDGWIGAEYRPRGTSQDGLGWLRRMASLR